MITLDLSPQRLPGEAFASYVSRRQRANEQIKAHLRGAIVWASGTNGTYNRRHNAAKRERRAAWKAARAAQVRDAWDTYGWRRGGAPKYKLARDLISSVAL